MKAVIQRVTQASVTVDGKIVGQINRGLVVLIGFGQQDQNPDLRGFADKISNLRIFPNEQGRFDRSCLDLKADILLVPQFTLYADTTKGRRPEFFTALKPDLAEGLFNELVGVFEKSTNLRIQTGIFGAQMSVSLVNDGPVTICL